jgi:ABC-type glycerol-3-phosphate transport system permease component
MRQIFFATLVLVVIFYSLAPFAWQVITSLQDPTTLFQTPVQYWPMRPSLASYQRVFEARPFARYIANSLLVSSASTVVCVTLAVLAAYAAARRLTAAARWANAGMFVLTLLPPIVLIVPLYALVRAAGLMNHPLALIIPYAAINLPLAIWILVAAIRQIPEEIEEAAALDGVGRLRIIFGILLPLIAPAMATAAILVFIASWNEFLLALTFMRDPSYTVPVGIAMLGGATSHEIPWDQISAAVVLTTLPVLLVVFIFQRRIVEGLTAGAVRE